MKSYIGCKIIQAEPCSEYDAIGDKEWESDRPNRPGYRVVYPDGYVS